MLRLRIEWMMRSGALRFRRARAADRALRRLRGWARRRGRDRRPVAQLWRKLAPSGLAKYFGGWKAHRRKLSKLQSVLLLAQQFHDEYALNTVQYNQFGFLLGVVRGWRGWALRAGRLRAARRRRAQAELLRALGALDRAFRGWKGYSINNRKYKNFLEKRELCCKRLVFLSWRSYHDQFISQIERLSRSHAIRVSLRTWKRFTCLCRDHRAIRYLQHWRTWTFSRLRLDWIGGLLVSNKLLPAWKSLKDGCHLLAQAQEHWRTGRKRASLRKIRKLSRSWRERAVFLRTKKRLQQKLRQKNEAFLDSLVPGKEDNLWWKSQLAEEKCCHIAKAVSSKDLALQKLVFSQWAAQVEERWQVKLIARRMAWRQDKILLQKVLNAWCMWRRRFC